MPARIRRRLRPLRRGSERAARLARDSVRWLAIARAPRPPAGRPRVFYGHDRMPSRAEPAHGGAVKFQSLNDAFPNARRDFNLLYLGSSTIPPDARTLVALARRRGARIVWNQDGVAYPGWFGPGYERFNRALARVLHAADHVFFQTEFCKLSADVFLGERTAPWEVLHNPVDTARFTPAEQRRRSGLTLLLGGNQYQAYRFETAVQTLALVVAERPDARLLVAGELSWSRATDPAAAPRTARRLVAELGLADRVDFLGAYTQADAPDLTRRADLLLHTKYNDPCPTVVLEAMACGLPVVYSASGGVPELVGADAGIGVPAPLDWDRDHPPSPEQLADAVLRVSERKSEFGEAARARAERFDVVPWIGRHRDVFERLVS